MAMANDLFNVKNGLAAAWRQLTWRLKALSASVKAVAGNENGQLKRRKLFWRRPSAGVAAGWRIGLRPIKLFGWPSSALAFGEARSKLNEE
jgi:hypothetical protein